MKTLKSGPIARCVVALASLLACALITAPLAAQSFFGSIVGTVTDSSGAVIANASATLTNTGTSEKKTAQTDANGNYQFLNLVPGMYKVDVEQQGFKHLTRGQVEVRVDTATRVDVALNVAGHDHRQKPGLDQAEFLRHGAICEVRSGPIHCEGGKDVLRIERLVRAPLRQQPARK